MVRADLLWQIVQSPHEVQDLHHVEPAQREPAAPRTVAVDGVAQTVRDGRACPAHEVVEEVVHQLDNVHDGLGAFDDLSVEGSLHVRLKQGLK